MFGRAKGLIGACALVALAGCDGGLPKNQPIQTQVALEAFGSCGDLESYVEDTAVLEMRTHLEQLKKGGYGWWGGPVATLEGDAAARGPTAYTTTNTQVSGVDEADFVKNDGTRIFVLSGGKLYANRSWPANQLATVGQLAIEGYPMEMYLDGDQVTVFSGVYTPFEDGSAGDPRVGCGDELACGYYQSNTLKVTLVDVADLAQPTVKGELYLPGHYVNSRKVGRSVRLVSSDSFRWPSEVRWYPEDQPGLWEDRALREKVIDELIAQNTEVIRAQSLDGWLPKGRYRAADGTVTEVGYDCREFARTNAPTRLGLVSLSTLNLNPGQLPDGNAMAAHRTSLISQAGEIYASPTALYVASGHWWFWPESGQVDHTYLHKFDISNPERAVYLASGGVEGHIVDQFAMDEHEGFFRVATTVTTRRDDPQNPDNIWGVFETTNRISVLGQNGAALSVVGRSEDLASGERIYSARFMGPKGYVVTFRQVDPLFTFDLSDPTAPRQVGELKIPGFSTYIHPLDDDHLLTIGVHLEEDGTWRNSSLKLSIFDVSDFANPTEKFTQLVGTASAWSDALYDHKAFNYFPERGLLAIPFSDWNYTASSESDYWSSFVSDLRVFSVSPQTGFTFKGAVEMKDLYRSETYESGDYRWTYYWTPVVRRSVMADEFVYAISDAGIRVSSVDALDAPVATTLFDRYRP